MTSISFKEYKQEGRLLYEIKKYDKAIKYFKKAEKLDETDCDLYLSMGLCYMNLLDYDNAKEMFLKAKKADEENGIVYFHLGNIELLHGHRNNGHKLYLSAIEKGYVSAQIYNSMALLAIEEKDDSKAVEYFTKAIDADPKRFDIKKQKALLLIKIGKYDAVQQIIEDMMGNGIQQKKEAYHLKYSLLIKEGRKEDAEAILKEAISVFPDDCSFEIKKANVLARNDRIDEAIDTLNSIEEHHSLNNTQMQEIAYEKAMIYKHGKNDDFAVECLEQCEKIAEEEGNECVNEKALYLLISFLIDRKRYKTVRDYAVKLKKYAKGNFFIYSGWYMEAYVEKLMSETKKAESLFKDAIRYLRSRTMEDPSDFYGYYYRTMCLKQLGKYSEALELASYMSKVHADKKEAHLLRAEILDLCGNKKEAAKERSFSGIFNKD